MRNGCCCQPGRESSQADYGCSTSSARAFVASTLRSHRGHLQLPANLRHDVKHLAGYYPASLVVGGGFGRRVIAKPGISIMDGIPGYGSLHDGTGFVGHAARHEGDEISSRIGVRVVEFGIRADRRSGVRIPDEIKGVVSRGNILDGKADAAHGSHGTAIAGSCLRSSRKSMNLVEAIIVC